MRRTESVEWRRLLRENLHREKGARQNQLEASVARSLEQEASVSGWYGNRARSPRPLLPKAGNVGIEGKKEDRGKVSVSSDGLESSSWGKSCHLNPAWL